MRGSPSESMSLMSLRISSDLASMPRAFMATYRRVQKEGFTFGLKPFSVLCFPCSRPTGVRSRVVGWRRNGVRRAGAGGP